MVFVYSLFLDCVMKKLFFLLFLLILLSSSYVSAYQLFTWGDNSLGQLGDGTNTNRNLPVQIGNSTDWNYISVGTFHTTVIKYDGTLWSWGNNIVGELGDGTTTDRPYPAQIGTNNDWANVFGGWDHTLAIKNDGSLWAWGYNAQGMLGDGTTIDKYFPIQIGTSTNWLQVAGGSAHTIAIKSDGTLWAWGWNAYGQLGNGTLIDELSPVQIGTDTDWSQVSCGYAHTFALKKDGTLWAWGWNSLGQLGDGTIVDKTSPVQIGTSSDWLQVSCGGWHNSAIQKDGTLWAWGYNSRGRVGDGTNINKTSPVQIGSDNNWSKAIGGGWQSFAIKNNHTLWAWGFNGDGRLGDGTTTDRFSPYQIGMGTNWTQLASGYTHAVALNNIFGVSIATDHYYDDMICINEEVLFTPKIDLVGDFSYSWKIDNQIYGEGTTLKQKFTSPGQYEIKLSAKCEDNSKGEASLIITVTDQCPVTVINENFETCKSSPITIYPAVFGGKGTYSYNWLPNSDFNDNTVKDATVKNPTYSKEFKLTATDIITNQKGPGYFYMTVLESPSVSFNKSYLYLKNSDPVDLSDEETIVINVDGGKAPYQYTWTNNNGIEIDPTNVTPPLGSSKYYLTVVDANGCKSYEKRLIIFRSNGKEISDDIISGLTGIGYMLTYPNPVTDNMSIYADFNTEKSAVLQIFNLLGNKLISIAIDNTNIFESQINLSSLIAGVYTIVIETSENTYMKQFIKQ